MQPKTISIAAFILLLLGFGMAGAVVVEYSAVAAWLLTMLLMVALILAAGYNIKGFWFGGLIDRSNKFSLSRLQLICWTVMVLSAFLTSVWINLQAGDIADPMAIAIPKELWILMGISTTSLVGSPLILGNKKEKLPAPDEIENIQEHAGCDHERRAVGLVMENLDPREAKWSDLFKGEEVGNSAYLDISRIQMFFFTLILLLGYGYTLADLFMNYGDPTVYVSGGIDALPAFSGGMLALLGISHTAYLGNKALPHTRTNSGAAQRIPAAIKPAAREPDAKEKAPRRKEPVKKQVVTKIPAKKQSAAAAKKKVTRKKKPS